MLSKRISKLLQLKEYKKDICETELQKTKESLNLEQNKLNAIERDIEEIISKYNECQQEGFLSIQQLEFLTRYLLYMNEKAEKQKSIVEKKIKEVHKKTEIALEALREKQVVEMMFDRLIKEEAKINAKNEQKEQDLNFLYNKYRS